jgi:hypothetical protein
MNGKDFSTYCNELKVESKANYNAQTNAAGDTVVDYINTKRTITAGIIPLNDTIMYNVLAEVNKFSVRLTFLDPRTKALSWVDCIIPSNGVEYYTIQDGKVLYNAMTLTFIEL